jgi:hypothetical protein
MESKVRSEPWYDGTWWEAEIPRGWSSLGRDKSFKGWPYSFGSPHGARLFVHVNDGSKTRMDLSCAPSELTATQRIAWSVAASDTAHDDIEPMDVAKMSPMALAALQFQLVASRDKRLKQAGARVTRQDRGPLVGFTHPLKSSVEVGWSGSIAIGSYWLVSWLAMKEWNQADADAGLDLLASITVHRPGS